MGKIGNGKGEELPFSENFGTHENKICTMTLSPLICWKISNSPLLIKQVVPGWEPVSVQLSLYLSNFQRSFTLLILYIWSEDKPTCFTKCWMELASFEIEGCEGLFYLCSTGFLFQFISENTSGYLGWINSWNLI